MFRLERGELPIDVDRPLIVFPIGVLGCLPPGSLSALADETNAAHISGDVISSANIIQWIGNGRFS